MSRGGHLLCLGFIFSSQFSLSFWLLNLCKALEERMTANRVFLSRTQIHTHTQKAYTITCCFFRLLANTKNNNNNHQAHKGRALLLLMMPMLPLLLLMMIVAVVCAGQLAAVLNCCFSYSRRRRRFSHYSVLIPDT